MSNLIWKIPAVIGGTCLTATAVWLNAEHVATSEGWNSPLVAAGIIVTICAASTPPLAERAMKSGQPAKAVMLWLFFMLAVGFSLSASITRSSGYVSGKVTTAETINRTAKLADEAYTAAKRSMEAECAKRGNRCRDMERKVDEARKTLTTTKPVQAVDAGSDRLAAVLGIDETKVQLYVPLLLPLGLEIGGFIFLAFGLSPRRREATVIITGTDEKPLQTVAKPAKGGSKDYYLQRLQREYPILAGKVARDEMSVYAATVAAGMRKAPRKKSHLKIVAN
ncbi:MAG TPA: hypothetical protein VMT30_02715 [Candidatus Saccharimonadia bacterium]|nr:hypothetical protein [Candidatus Saccharimonadia bacterium]